MSVMRKTDILLQWDNEKRSPLGPSVDRFRVPRFGQRRGYILYFLHLPSSDKDIHLPLISTWSWSELQLWFRWRRWYWTLIELLVPLWEVQYAERTCTLLVPTAPDWVLLSGARPQHFTNSLAIINLCRIFEVWILSPVTGNAWPIALFNLQHRYWPDHPIPSLNTSIAISQIHSWKESWTRRKFSKNNRHSLERNS